MEQPELSLAQLSSMAGLNKTTTHRLLRALQSEALVDRNSATSTYRLGAGLMALGVQALASSDLRRRVRPLLKSLAHETGETATLEVPIENCMLILDEVAGSHLIAATGHVGTRWPLHSTSTGKAYMAFADDTSQRLFEPLLQVTPKTIISIEEFQRQLADVRKRGFALAADELEVGYTAVAVVVRGVLGDVQGCISLGGPSHRMTPSRCAELGTRLTNAVSRLQL
jgi:DNA-binding IclR family transcriptional regulator